MIEAKMFSGIAPGVKFAPDYAQVCRNVACMAEVLKIANRAPDKMKQLGFYVFAPKPQIEKSHIGAHLKREHVREGVKKRVAAYKGEKAEWFFHWFIPTVERIDLGFCSWEEAIKAISKSDSKSARSLESFYERCKKFNGARSR